MLQSCPDPGVMLHMLFNRVTRSFTQKISLPNSVLQDVRSCFDRWTYTEKVSRFCDFKTNVCMGHYFFSKLCRLYSHLYTHHIYWPFLKNQKKHTKSSQF